LLPRLTLEQWLKDLADRHEHMPQPDVIATIAQLASTLDTAHAISVIHRDVKPSDARYNAVMTALPAVLPVVANVPTAVAVNPIDQLRALLVSGDTDGQISMGGEP
jgi:hypothetical protein